MLYVNITALNLCRFFSLIFQEISLTPLEEHKILHPVRTTKYHLKIYLLLCNSDNEENFQLAISLNFEFSKREDLNSLKVHNAFISIGTNMLFSPNQAAMSVVFHEILKLKLQNFWLMEVFLVHSHKYYYFFLEASRIPLGLREIAIRSSKFVWRVRTCLQCLYAITLLHWTQVDRRWKRKAVSRLSPSMNDIRWPQITEQLLL